MRYLSWIALVGLIAGCSSNPDRIVPPTIDAAQAGKDAITEYDKNGNGQLDGAELDSVPGIKAALAKVDKDSDKQVSAEEITQRINVWKEDQTGIMSLSCRVILDGKPLEGADIVFVPEKFLGPHLKLAKGKTGPGGTAMCTINDPDLAAKRLQGAQCGFYRVEISGGPKSIPAKYNTSTTIGEEVAPDADWVKSGSLVFELKGK